MTDPSSLPITRLPRTSHITMKRLQSLGIHTYFDLLHYFPFRYEDYTKIVTLKDIVDQGLFSGDDQKNQQGLTVFVKIVSFRNVITRQRKWIQKVECSDGKQTVELVWFNQPYLRNIFKPGINIALSGYMRQTNEAYTFQPSEYEVIEGDRELLHTGRLVPVYPQIRGLSSKTIREKMWHVLQECGKYIPEILPDVLLNKYSLVPENTAYPCIHFPAHQEDISTSTRRLAFDELFTIQLSSHLIKKEWEEQKPAHRIQTDTYKKEISAFESCLPFSLTRSQKKSLSEVLSDLQGEKSMNRLLQGDVGSGKTVVSAMAAYAVYLNGYKTLLMAPTDILAKQHYNSFQTVFSVPEFPDKPNVVLYTRTSKPTKEELDTAAIIIGTHALISKKDTMSDIGFIIIDEQHKFGVSQRAALKEKGNNPHLLTMTATPIPRTVMLTLYGQLDVSVINELPKGRKHVKTHLVPQRKRRNAYAWIKELVQKNHEQVFIVCPIIDESSAETMKSVRAATKEFEKLSREDFAGLKVGLLHGKCKTKEKDDVMNSFARGDLDVLVSTPVVEVGIDVPNATVIVVEAAERFGLAQLHQLRGRVGRSDKQSYAFLFTEQTGDNVLERLTYFSKEHDGFSLAQYDLEKRGAGTLYGTKQHGFDELNIASITDRKLVEETKEAVTDFLCTFDYNDFAGLQKRIRSLQTEDISRD